MVQTGDRSEAQGIGWAAAAVAFAALVLYLATLAPTIGWGDSADLAMRMVSDADPTFVHGTRDYVLYRLVGGVFQALPIGDAGTRANLATAVFGAATVGLVAVYAGRLSGSALAAFGAGAAIAVAHSFWLLAVAAEVYTFTLLLAWSAFLALAAWCRGSGTWALLAAAGCAGLSLSHHATGLPLAAALAPLVLIGWRRLTLAAALGALAVWAAGAGIYWDRAWTDLMAGEPWLKAFEIVPRDLTADAGSRVRELAKAGLFAGYNFAGLGLLLAPLGLWWLWQARAVSALPPLLWAGGFLWVGVVSPISDKHNIYVLVYPTVALLVGLGVAALLNLVRLSPALRVSLIALLAIGPIATYAATVPVTRALGITLFSAREVIHRDNAWFFLWPPKSGDWGPRRFAEEAFAAVEPRAVLITDYTLWRPLLFLQAVEGARDDVELVFVEPLFRGRDAGEGVDAFIARQDCARPVYLAADRPASYYELDAVLARFGLEPAGPVFRVTGRDCS